MPVSNLINQIRGTQRSNTRDRYLAERNALDLLEINLEVKDKEKSDYLTGAGNDYKMLLGQLSDRNITEEELKSVKGSLGKIGKGFKKSEYNDDTVVGSFHNFYESQLNEAIEDVDDSMKWRGTLQDIVTSLDNIPKYDEKVGAYNTQHTIDIMKNITNQKSYYADNNQEILDTLGQMEQVGVQRNYVQSQLERYRKEPPPATNPTMQSAVNEAAEARSQGNWNLAYSILTGAVGSDVTDAKSTMLSPVEIQLQDAEKIRKGLLQNLPTKQTEAQLKQTGELYEEIQAIVNSAYSKTDFSLNSAMINEQMTNLRNKTIEMDSRTQDSEIFGTNNKAYAAWWSGMISETGDGWGNYNYADNVPYMRKGVVQPGKALGEYNMEYNHDISETMVNNYSSIIYDISDKIGREGEGSLSYTQSIMAGVGRAYLQTHPDYTDNEWVKREIEEENEGDVGDKTVKGAKKLNASQIKNSNSKYKKGVQRVSELTKERNSIINFERNARPTLPSGKSSKEASDDKIISILPSKSKKRISEIELAIRKINVDNRKIQAKLGDELLDSSKKSTKPWYDTEEVQNLIPSK